MTRLGKIARLPRDVREELNRRLADGEIGKGLVEWLNTLPVVQAVLAAEFGGRPINEQNLSEWKQGGYEEWVGHQEARAWAAQLVEHAEDLNAEAGAIPLAERAALPVLVALHQVLQKALAGADGPEQLRAVLGVAQQLAQLRRANHGAERLRIERERWAARQEDDREKKQKEAETDAQTKRIQARLFPDMDEDGFPKATTLPPELQEIRVANARLRASGWKPPNQGESNQIKPNQGEWKSESESEGESEGGKCLAAGAVPGKRRESSAHGGKDVPEEAGSGRGGRRGARPTSRARRTRANQGDSNQIKPDQTKSSRVNPTESDWKNESESENET